MRNLKDTWNKIKLRGRHSKITVRNGRLIKRFESKFAYNFWKEAYFLNLLQPYGFVPILYSVNPQLLEIEMEFLNGIYFSAWIELYGCEKKVLQSCLRFCYTLDRLGIRKEEMTHPDRHIIIVGSKPYFIDFERAHFVSLNKNPGNLNQFVVYLSKMRLIELDEELIWILKNYKKTGNERFLKLIFKLLG